MRVGPAYLLFILEASSLRQSLGGSRFFSMLGEEIRRQLKELLESLTNEKRKIGLSFYE